MIARIDLDPLKDEICQQWDARVPKSDILEWINEQGDLYTICSLSTLKRTFTRWSMKWEGPNVYNDILGVAGSEAINVWLWRLVGEWAVVRLGSARSVKFFNWVLLHQ